MDFGEQSLREPSTAKEKRRETRSREKKSPLDLVEEGSTADLKSRNIPVWAGEGISAFHAKTTQEGRKNRRGK